MSPTLVAPVTRRKTSRTAAVRDEETRVPVRIRTRGPMKRIAPIDDSRSIGDFVDGLRRPEDLPLVVLVFGDATDPNGAAARFASAVDRQLTAADATWIIARNGGSLPFGVVTGTVATLDEREPQDRRIWKNLVADILFFAADDASDEESIDSFRKCAPCVIVPSDAARLQSFGHRAVRACLPVLTFSAGNDSIASPPPEMFWDLTLPAEEPGQRLAEIATQLSTNQKRRRLFSAVLQSFRPASLDDDAWSREVIRLADRFRWPRWTVASMPRRYVMTEEPREAYLWRLMYDCVMKLGIETRARLCNGEIFHIQAPDNVHLLIAEIDQQLDAEMQRIKFIGDTSLFGRLGDILDDVAQKWAADQPELSSQIRSVIARVTGREW